MGRVIARLRSLWRVLTSRAAFEQEMDEEFRHHLELRTRDLIRTGLSPQAAARQARIEFGSMASAKESARASRGLRLIDELHGDLRYGLRALLRSPGFAVVAVLMLGLGIGANTAIFSALDAALLRPLPFAEPRRLVELEDVAIPFRSEGDAPEKSMPDIIDARGLDGIFTDVVAYAPGGLNLSGSGRPRRIDVGAVTTGFFSALGVRPRLGRGFSEEEGRPGADRVVIVSEPFWRTHLGAVEDLRGQQIVLNGVSHEVVGVAPAGFAFPERAEVWLPLSIPLTFDSFEPFRQYIPSRMIARLAPGVSVETARAAVLSLQAPYRDAYPEFDPDAVVRPLRSSLVGERRGVLVVLMGATGLVLLVACANLANLLLSRGLARRHELVLRTSLGATRSRVLRQLLTESLLLATLGGLVGVAIAWLGVRALDPLVPAALAGVAPLRIDARVLGFAAALVLATGVAFGILPALTSHQTSAAATLKSGRTGTSDSSHTLHVRRALVLGEIALAVTLLIGSTLMLRSLQRLLATESGVEPEQVATLELSLAEGDYASNAERRRFYEALLTRLNAMPEVEAAAVINELPLRGEGGVRFLVRPAEWPDARRITDPRRLAQDLRVTADYFDVMGIPVLLGRPPRPRPDSSAVGEVAINRTLAELYWPGRSPIGQRLEVPGGRLYEIVGVVADVRGRSLEDKIHSQTYYALLETPYDNAAIVARGRPGFGLAALLERAVHEVAPQQAVYNVRTMEQVIRGAIAPRRANTALITTFGLLALLLATVGVYGVIAFNVTLRRSEMGIRVALGATPWRLRRSVLTEAVAVASAGTVVGAAGAWMLAGVLGAFVYGITTRDPVSFVVGPLMLLVAAGVAALLPARRAARIDPLQTIRAE